MKQKLTFLACIAAISLLSCSDNKGDKSNNSTINNQDYVLPSTLNNQEQSTNSSTTTNNETISMQPVKTDQVAINPGNANVKLNPAHGEPGHRCDIAVGAPLDGSVQQTTNVQPVTANTQPAIKTTTNSNAKLNPAHGQPGHRCDIAVGAPLDGSVQQTTNVQPVTVNTQPAITTTSNSNVKLNPAHGQPGHRCDLAVGAPLDGSTATKTNTQKTDAKNPLQYFPTVNKVDPNASKPISVDAVKKDTTKN